MSEQLQALADLAARLRRRVEWEGVSLFVVSPEDLLLSKLVWSRGGESELQMRDVRRLLASVDDLDREHLAEWAPELGVADLLDEVLG